MLYRAADLTCMRSILRRVGATALVVLLASCEHEAWLGGQCPEAAARCDVFDAASDAKSAAPDTAMFDAGTPTRVGSVADDAQVAAVVDAGPEDAAAERGSCRRVTMSYFACASNDEMPGVPQLKAGGAYTLRFQGAYTVATTFQLQGSSSKCMATMLGTLSLAAGEAMAERCVRPSEDLALLVTVVSGDVRVWNQDGIRAELCDGCADNAPQAPQPSQ